MPIKFIEDIIDPFQKKREKKLYVAIDFHRVWQDKEDTNKWFFQLKFWKFKESGFQVALQPSMVGMDNGWTLS